MQMDLLTKQEQTHGLREGTYSYQGQGWEEGLVRQLGMDVYTLLYLKWITSKDLLSSTGTLLSVMWLPGWEGNLGEMDSFVCSAESLQWSPETITTLSVYQLYPQYKTNKNKPKTKQSFALFFVMVKIQSGQSYPHRKAQGLRLSLRLYTGH